MKRVKPGRIVEEEVQDQEVESKALSPQRLDENEVYEEIEKEEKKRLTSLKAIGGFATKGVVVAGLLASLIVVGTIYDAAFTASSMLSNVPVVGIVYLLLLFSLVGIVGYTLVKQYIGYAKLKKIDDLQAVMKEVKGLDLKAPLVFGNFK